jgi:uncharacterized protein YndB with AHSA1/START domain
MSEPAVIHSTFRIERVYPHKAARVFAAFRDSAQKRKWFVEGEGFHVDSYTADFRVGGFEVSHFRFGEGPPMSNHCVHQDIVDDTRMVFAYTMALDGKRFSSSLTTIELVPEAGGTRLTYTEQGAFLNGEDQTADRRAGCASLLEILAQHLDG